MAKKSNFFGEGEQIEKINMIDEIANNFISYANQVNFSRSFPSVFDGLKPGQRRILFALWELGVKPKSLVKAAKAVAVTMGDYHPHGDCLDGDTIFVSSCDGLPNTSIAELFDSGVSSFPVWAYNGDEMVKTHAHSFRVGQITEEKYHVVFPDDFEVVCTANHPFLTKDGVWVKAEEMLDSLAKGDSIHLWSEVFCGSEMSSSSDYLEVDDIYVTKCDPTPMYDFTVSDVENAAIVVYGSSEDSFIGRSICVHNSAIHETIAHMEQDFIMREPLIFGQGSWGTVSNPEPAAMRYPECSLSEAATLLLGAHPWTGSKRAEIDEGFMPMVPTYDAKRTEPITLPSLFPNLIVNGYIGTGVGVAGVLPQHDLTETLDLALHLIDSPNTRISTVMKKLPGPDIPTGCLVYDNNGGIQSYFETGIGNYVMRAKYHFEKVKNKDYIIFTNLPYQVKPIKVVDGIKKLIKLKKIPLDVSVENHTSKELRISVYCGKSKKEDILNLLLHYSPVTQLQKKGSVLNIVVRDNSLEIVGIVDCVRSWINYRYSCILDRSEAKRNDFYRRVEIIDGYLKMGPISDEILKLVKGSENKKEAAGKIISKWGFTDIQTEAILSLNISQLTKVAKRNYSGEKADLLKEIKFLDSIKNDFEVLKTVLKDEIRHVKKTLSTPRKSIIMEGDHTIPKPALNISESAIEGYLAITHGNWLRWLSRTNINRDIDGDYVDRVIKLDTNDPVVAVTSEGRGVLIDTVALSKNKKGYSNTKMLLTSLKEGLLPGEEIVTIMPAVFGEDLVLFTQKGGIKRLMHESFGNQRKSKMFFLSKLKKDDKVVSAGSLQGVVESQMFIGVTSKGKMLAVDMEQIAPKKGNAASTMPFMKMSQGDQLVSGFVVDKKVDSSVIYVTEDDNMARIFIPNITPKNRNTIGQSIIRPSDSIKQAIFAENSGTIIAGQDDFQEVPYSDIPLGTNMTPKGMLHVADSSHAVMLKKEIDC